MITPDTSAPLVVVVGSTGIQGGSVIKALSDSDRAYRIRGVTRDPSKPSAVALAEQGVEVVACDLTVDNKEQVFRVVSGASYFFAVTNFWEHTDKAREIAEGKLLVDAAEAANVRLLVWSGLPSYKELSDGKYVHVYHFDSKAEVTQYAKDRGIPFANVMAGAYMSNYKDFSAPQKQEDGSFVITGVGAPESVLPLIDAHHDYGLFVRAAIESPVGTNEGEWLAGTEVISMSDIAKQLADGTGTKVVYVQLTKAQLMAVLPFPTEDIKREVLETFLVIAEYGYYGKADIAPGLKYLAKTPQSWKDFVKATDWTEVLK